MIKFLAPFFLFLSSALYAQQPTHQPSIRTRELPEQMQNPMTVFLIIFGMVLVIALILYFVRADKYIKRRFRK